MRVLVLGGDTAADRVARVLGLIYPEPTTVLRVGPGGAGSAAATWAEDHGAAVETIEPDVAVARGDVALVVAFPGGTDSDAVLSHARSAGVRVMRAA